MRTQYQAYNDAYTTATNLEWEIEFNNRTTNETLVSTLRGRQFAALLAAAKADATLRGAVCSLSTAALQVCWCSPRRAWAQLCLRHSRCMGPAGSSAAAPKRPPPPPGALAGTHPAAELLAV